MNIFKLTKKIYYYVKKSRFIAEFKRFDRSSGFGSIGYGDNCKIIGKENMCIGHNTWFGYGCELYAYNTHFFQQLNSELIIGDNVRSTARCRITCAGKITIGNNVLIAPEVFITDHNHGMDPTDERGYSPQPLKIANVIIEDGVWLGHRSTILPGVTIGKHSIIGANSVVTTNIPEYSMAVGVPARVIKKWNMKEKRWERV